jgi:hypothetical protein
MVQVTRNLSGPTGRMEIENDPSGKLSIDRSLNPILGPRPSVPAKAWAGDKRPKRPWLGGLPSVA